MRLAFSGAAVRDLAAPESYDGLIATPGPECPLTIPSQGFTPPDGYPPSPVDPDSVWFGKDQLWTVLSTDGSYQPRKSSQALTAAGRSLIIYPEGNRPRRRCAVPVQERGSHLGDR